MWVGTFTDVLKYRFAREFCALRPPQMVNLGWVLSFDNLVVACKKYATALTLEFNHPNIASDALRIEQAGQPLVHKAVRPGVSVVQAHPLMGEVLIR